LEHLKNFTPKLSKVTFFFYNNNNKKEKLAYHIFHFDHINIFKITSKFSVKKYRLMMVRNLWERQILKLKIKIILTLQKTVSCTSLKSVLRELE